MRFEIGDFWSFIFSPESETSYLIKFTDEMCDFILNLTSPISYLI